MHRKLLPCLAAIVLLALHSCGDDDNDGNSFTYDEKKSNLTQGIIFRHRSSGYFYYYNSIELYSDGFTMQDNTLRGKGDVIAFYLESESGELPEGTFSSGEKPSDDLKGVTIILNHDTELETRDAYLADWSESTVRVKKVRNKYSIMFSGILNGKRFKGSYFGPLELRP